MCYVNCKAEIEICWSDISSDLSMPLCTASRTFWRLFIWFSKLETKGADSALGLKHQTYDIDNAPSFFKRWLINSLIKNYVVKLQYNFLPAGGKTFFTWDPAAVPHLRIEHQLRLRNPGSDFADLGSQLRCDLAANWGSGFQKKNVHNKTFRGYLELCGYNLVSVAFLGSRSFSFSSSRSFLLLSRSFSFCSFFSACSFSFFSRRSFSLSVSFFAFLTFLLLPFLLFFFSFLSVFSPLFAFFAFSSEAGTWHKMVVVLVS